MHVAALMSLPAREVLCAWFFRSRVSAISRSSSYSSQRLWRQESAPDPYRLELIRRERAASFGLHQGWNEAFVPPAGAFLPSAPRIHLDKRREP
jgi:hypothetical protein